MHQITLTIPDNLYNHVHRLARAASKPVEKLLLTALHTSLPSLDGLPADMIRELTDLENRNADELREVLSETVSPEQQEMMESLLHRNQLGIISQAENEQLTSLQQAADRVMLRKARAAVLLRFRGERLPTLAELRRRSFWRMTKSYLPASLREQIARQGRYRCGYCLRTEELMGMPMTIDHIVPSSAGGSDTEENLCLACRRCNEFKGKQTHARDPETGERVRMFNPRRQKWNEHFQWSEDGTEIVGRTPCGRATADALRMNNPEITVARRLWVSVGWWPPDD